jgi:hypothetical protein
MRNRPLQLRPHLVVASEEIVPEAFLAMSSGLVGPMVDESLLR